MPVPFVVVAVVLRCKVVILDLGRSRAKQVCEIAISRLQAPEGYMHTTTL